MNVFHKMGPTWGKKHVNHDAGKLELKNNGCLGRQVRLDAFVCRAGASRKLQLHEL